MTMNPTPAPLSPEREAEIRSARYAILSLASADVALDDLLAELDRVRAERDRATRAFEALMAKHDQVKTELDVTTRAKQENDERLLTMASEQQQRANLAEAERDELKKRVAVLDGRLNDAAMTRVWTNEDGKKFVFVEDIAPALLGMQERPGQGTVR